MGWRQSSCGHGNCPCRAGRQEWAVTRRGPRGLGVVVTQYLARTALSHRICTGLSRRRLGALIGELAGPWMASEAGRLHERRGHERLRAAGAGPNHELVLTDRMIATLVILRFNSHTPPWPCSTARTAPQSPALFTRSVHCLPHGASHFPASPTCGFARLRTCSRPPLPRASSRGSTAPRSRSAARARTSPAPRLRLGQAQAEHQEGHRHHRREGPHAVDRGVPARPHA